MPRLEGMPPVLQPRRPEDFDLLYEGTPPWEIGRPQPALLALAEAGRSGGGSWTWAAGPVSTRCWRRAWG